MDAFERIYGENRKMVFFYLNHVCRSEKLAEDLAQETFYRTLMYMNTSKDTCVNKAWLVKAAHSVFIDYCRKNKIKEISYEEIDHYMGDHTFSTDQKLDITGVLEKLPVKYKSVLILRDYFGFSYGEISRILSLSIPVTKVTLHRARNKFKEVYKKYGGEA